MLTKNNIRPHQKEMLLAATMAIAQDKYLFIYGGQGTFKTTSSVIALWQTLRGLSRYYNGLRITVGAINYKQLRDAFLATWYKEVPSDEYQYDKALEEIRLTGEGVDTVILLRHAGDAQEGKSAERASKSRRGGSITGFYFPQAESLSHSYYSQVESMLRGEPTKRPGFNNYPPYRIRFLDANPESPFHFLFKMFIDQTSETYIGDKAITLSINTTPETSAYTTDQIDTFRRTWSPHRIARMLDAQWVGASGLVYEKLDMNTHISTFDPPPNCIWYLAIDFGFHAPFCALLIGMDSEGRTWVLDEKYEAGVTIDEWALRLSKWWPELEIRRSVVDPAQSNDWRSLQKYMKIYNRPISVLLANKAITYGIQLYSTRLSKEGFENIHKRCSNFIKELLSYEWEISSDGKPIKEHPADRGMDHALDARRYYETTVAVARKRA